MRLPKIIRSALSDRFLLLLGAGMALALALVYGVGGFPSSSPVARQGALDLSGWDLAVQGSVKLNGEWTFYPGRLLEPMDFARGAPSGQVYLQVPGTWDGKQMSGRGYGTYRLEIRLRPTDRLLALHKQVIRFADRIYVNGKLLSESGRPGTSRAAYEPGNTPATVAFYVPDDRIELVVQTANYDYPSGGIALPISFGLESDLQWARQSQSILEWAGVVVLLLFSIFFLSLHVFFQRDSAFVLFGGFFFCFSVMLLFNGQRMFMELVPEFPFEWRYKIKDLSLFLTLPFLYGFTATIYSTRAWRVALGWPAAVICAYCALILVSPYRVYSWLFVPATALYACCMAGMTLLVLGAYAAGRYGRIDKRELQFYIMALCCLILTTLNSAFRNRGDGTFLSQSLSDAFVLLFVLFTTLMLAYRYFQTYAAMVKLTERLQAADQLKDDFLLRTSHELNTPLHGIMNLSQAMLEAPGVPPPERAERDKLQAIRNTAYRMSNLVNDIIDLARIKDGRLEVAHKTVDLATCAAIGFEVCGFLAREKGIRLDNRIQAEARYATADENRLMQVLSSLLDRSLRLPNLTSVAVESERSNNGILLAMTAFGSAEAAPAEEELFGAGIAVARELVREMGGSLKAEPWSRTGELRFAMELPAAPDPATDAPAGARAAAGSAEAAASAESESRLPNSGAYSYTVLVVDGELVHTELVVGLLAREGYRVLTAHTGEEALRIVAQPDRPDIVLLDVLLPGGQSYEISRRIRRRFSPIDLPLLFVTGRSTPADVEAGLAAGGNDFLKKPIDPGEVRVRIRTLLAMKRLAKEAAQSEMAFLQSQIKPHFLYNALGTIMSLCYTDGPRAGELLSVLSKYLRIIFHEDHKEDRVLLSKEMELVRAYVDIEQARFGQRLRIVFDVDEALLGCRILPLTVQPLVENAIRHGVAKKVSGGQVKLTVRRQEKDVVIVVEDDGIGMTRREIEELTGADRSQGGVGFANIMKRLANQTGDKPLVESEPGRGTRVTIKLPYTESAEHPDGGD
ncbi:histidine kinase [Cohnella sp. REN36]|uniref:hybrid sensor histidine kinase/response regulator n=1 Tax=Cohnella sp. REN36 TaxID=2887347 RepID=UPI001D14762A|nr:histidine kinase [Cohnella sp. REN36]MCC3375072.1 histidine kinase [Cohnella sp. REN36]